MTQPSFAVWTITPGRSSRRVTKAESIDRSWVAAATTILWPASGATPVLPLAAELRSQGFKVEWYPQADRLPKQLKYADRLGIPLAVIEGPEEIAAGEVTLKDLRARTQERIARPRLAARLRAMLEPSRAT